MAKKKVAKTAQKDENKIVKFYNKNYKKFLILPILMFIFAAVMIVNTTEQEGTPIYRDVSLKGGLSAIVEIENNMQSYELQEILENKYPDNSFSVSALTENGEDTGYIIDTDLEETKLVPELETVFGTLTQGENYTSNFISSSLSDSFFRQAMIALIFSFIFMSLVVFLYFREKVPSGAVVLSAIFDIVVTVGILDFMGTKLSVAGLGAIIMLVGYSIDTDVLLTNRLIKEPGTDYHSKTFFAFKTGTLMSGTTLIAGLGAMFITNSSVIFEIAMILVIGLIVDYISTWIQNTAILLWWLDSSKKKF